MKSVCAGVTHSGLVRINNEDNIYIDGEYRADLSVNVEWISPHKEQEYHTLAVFDGVGGAEYGENASLICAEFLASMDNEGFYKQHREYIFKLNATVCEILRDKGLRSMGSTVALVSIYNDDMYLCNVGDSRIYIYREGRLVQVSKDHTSVQSMIDNGVIDESERKSNKFRHTLIQYIGCDDDCSIVPYVNAYRLKCSDIILVCSDGLTDMIEDVEIEKIIHDNKQQSPNIVAETLLNQALQNGGKDNISVVIAKMED